MSAFQLAEHVAHALAQVAHAAHHQAAAVARDLLEHVRRAQVHAAVPVSSAALLTLAQLLDILPDEYRVDAALTREGFVHLRLSQRAATVLVTLYPLARVRYSIVDEPHLGTSERLPLTALLHVLEHQTLAV